VREAVPLKCRNGAKTNSKEDRLKFCGALTRIQSIFHHPSEIQLTVSKAPASLCHFPQFYGFCATEKLNFSSAGAQREAALKLRGAFAWMQIGCALAISFD
jgi:hypothetical protein